VKGLSGAKERGGALEEMIDGDNLGYHVCRSMGFHGGMIIYVPSVCSCNRSKEFIGLFSQSRS
jgi:hypothetical protein